MCDKFTGSDKQNKRALFNFLGGGHTGQNEVEKAKNYLLFMQNYVSSLT
jgi:hypothetical protein